jgi:lysophospholipase L1-like esterase
LYSSRLFYRITIGMPAQINECTKPEKTIARLRAGQAVRIVALGDSLTYGWMAEKGYIDFLQALLKERYPAAAVSFLNRGIPGDTARGGLERLNEQVIEQKPDLVFVQFGLNDAFCGCPPVQYAATVSRIIERLCNESSAEILLLTSVALADPRENEIALKYYAELERLSREQCVPIARVHAFWQEKTGGDFKGLVQADLVHPTAAGYRLMAEAIMQVLE